jgi:hypothetical protein
MFQMKWDGAREHTEPRVKHDILHVPDLFIPELMNLHGRQIPAGISFH